MTDQGRVYVTTCSEKYLTLDSGFLYKEFVSEKSLASLCFKSVQASHLPWALKKDKKNKSTTAESGTCLLLIVYIFI